MRDCYCKTTHVLDPNLRLMFSGNCLFTAEVKFCTNVHALPTKGKT